MHLHKITKVLLMSATVLYANYSYARASNSENNGQCYEVVDRYEKFNRAMFEIDLTLDHTILKPISQMYRGSVPGWGRDRIKSFVENLRAPLTLLNNTLQGDSPAAFATFWRMAINSTIGIGGLFDFASGFGLKERQQVFADTFTHYGAKYGSYMVLPILGPSTITDGTGLAFNAALNPTNLVFRFPTQVEIYAASTIINRAEFIELTNSLEESSLDYYAQIRSMYIQYRAKNNPACKSQEIDYNMYDEETKK